MRSIQSAAGGTGTIDVQGTSAAEAIAGVISRAFMIAEVQTSNSSIQAALDPRTLGWIGRTLMTVGEIVMRIDVRGGTLSLLPAHSVTVFGNSPHREEWTYELTVAGPGMTVTSKLPAESVIHVQYAFGADTPWTGYGPLQGAKEACRLSAETTRALGG